MGSVRRAINGRIARFKIWWRSPASRADRMAGALVGAFGGFWVGFFAVLLSASSPVALGTVDMGALGGALPGVLLALRHPKGATLLLFPLAIFGIGSGS